MPTATVTPREHNFSNDPIYIEVETSLMSGAEAPYTPDEDNLWCEINVVTKGAGDIVDQTMKFRNPYSRYNKTARIDLSGVISIASEAPSNNLLEATPGILVTSVLNHVRTVEVSVADAFGIPLEPDTPVDLDPFKVVKGGTKYYQGFGDPITEALLYNGIDEYGKVIVKQVRKDQPEVLCFYVHEAKDIYVNIQVYFKDGTISGENFIATVSAVANVVNIIQCGWNQLDIDSILTDDLNVTQDEVEYYKIILGDLDTGDGLNYAVYQLDDRIVSRDTYLAFGNGIGGVEIARFSGKHRKNINASSDLAVKPPTVNINWANDPIYKTNASAHESVTLNSGYISKGEADKLGQMMLGEAYLVDNARKRFYKVYIQAVNMPVWDDDSDLYTVEVTYRTHDFKDYNRFNH